MTKPRLLFLHSNPVFTDSIISNLMDFGLDFLCKTSDTKDGFISQLSGFKPNLVFVVTPLRSGLLWDAIRIVKTQDSSKILLVVSKENNIKEIEKCYKQGVTDYISIDNFFRLGIAVSNLIDLSRYRENIETNSNDTFQSYLSFMDQATDAIFKGDYEGNFTEVNKAAIDLTGYSEIELLSMNMSDIFPKDELSLKPLEYSKVDRGDVVVNERNILSKDGKVIPVEMNTKLTNNKDYFCIMRNLIERDTDRKQIATSQERINNIVEHSSNLFYSHNTDGQFTYVSPKTRDFFDCEPDFFKKMSSSFFTNNPVNELGKISTNKAIITGESQPPFMLELVGKSGRKIWVEVNETPIKKNGKVDSIVGTLVDITDLKKVSDELIDSEKKFRTLFSEAPDPIFLIDKKGFIIDCNHAYCKLMEGDRKDFINRHVTVFIAKEDLHIFRSNFHILKEKGKFETEIVIITNKNKRITVRRNISALYDDNGDFAGAISHSHDITHQNKIQEQIKIREQQLSILINASPDIICFKDSECRWLLANGALLSLFQIEKLNYIGKTNKEIANHSSKYNNYFKHCTETDEFAWDRKQTITTEEKILMVDGKTKTIEVIKVPVFNSDGSRKALVVLGRDITIRRELENQLLHSHKMEAIGLMASGLAHNFNNILQSIVAYIDFAKEGLDIKTQRWEDIDQINKHVKRATLITKSLLAMGKEQFMNTTEIDIDDILLPIVEATNRNNKNGIFVDYRPQELLPSIVADGGQIDQVIMNLLINARDAMPNGGKITLVTQSVSITKDYCISNSWAKPGDFILISITDTGIGMDPDTKRRIFEPYFTTKGLDKGTGLGLSTAFGIISQHKGLVDVISEPNKGSTFNIYLPRNND